MGIEVPDAVKCPIRRLRVFLGDLLVPLERGLVIARGRLLIGLEGLQPGWDDL